MTGKNPGSQSTALNVYDNHGFQREDATAPGQHRVRNLDPDLPPQYAASPVPQYAAKVNTQQSHPPLSYKQSAPWRSTSGCKVFGIMLTVVFTLLVLVAAAVLIWYFVFRNCESGPSCASSGECIGDSEWCDRVPNCPKGEDETQYLRLYGSNFLLQVYSRKIKSWKPVCSDQWTDNNGKEACEQLGYSRSSYYKSVVQSATDVSFSEYWKLNTGRSTSNGKFHLSLVSSTSCLSRSVLSLQCIDCGRRPLVKTSSPRIVGGTPAQLGDWPWQVSLQTSGGHVCGGSIIAPSWIVTAAHCVEGRNSAPSIWKVYAGTVDQRNTNIINENKVEKIISHKGYVSRTNDNDVALMKLMTPLTFTDTVQPVCLPNAGQIFTQGQECWISGWGSTISGGSVSRTLMKAMVPLIDTTICNGRTVYNGAIKSSMVCAGYLSGGIDTCQGDSGGPLVTQKNSVWWLVGDTSWGDGCAKRNRPGVYGRMTSFVDWIYQQMQANP